MTLGMLWCVIVWEIAMFSRLRRLLRAAGRDAVVLWYACRNPATPISVKLIAALLAVYVVSPIDLVPDTIPILGWIDDVALLGLGIPAVLKLVPSNSLSQASIAAEKFLSKWKFWRAKS
jgi:uncharacterized membrane protein YkvA (DUF1232 family)